MFLSFLIWLRNISRYIPRGSDVTEEHKVGMFLGDLTWPRNMRTHLMFLGLTGVHKLCTSVFKPRNVFSVMNIGPEEHKKPRNECLFSVVLAWLV
jgi:hypothetical protein